ncbi:unnamed protein product [Protopolystoma xenopodis]|uniref:Uncharacterized protein n=1 Tax=Protopolystoma xenopodis TaxID=117903 RepID=A0A3S4ZZL9_9PLAT|nr:unnamed protein product [Protopolystoma xenopodis]
MKDILLASEQALQRRFLEHQSAVARIACDQLDADKHLDKILANRRQDQSDLLARLTSEVKISLLYVSCLLTHLLLI